MRPISIGSIVSILVASILATPVDAAPPEVPTSVLYQGRLLDEFGQPRTGSVDLTLRIYDAVVGGTLVYRQDFPSVLLADGVFSVQLGPTGEATDSPADPLATVLAIALAADAGPTAPLRFFELTVGSEDALARTQILASPYALRAASAASADTAASSSQVGGFPSEWISQLLTHTLADGSEPPNTDPREGLADPDGDGLSNFVDPDNDGDALRDGIEVSQGSDINLITPTLDGISPTIGPDDAPTQVTVTGTNFQPDLTFSIGTQTPSVANLTATSFQASVDPQTVGNVDVTVTLANGQSRTLADAFTFEPATLAAIPHAVSLGSYSARAAAYDLAVKPGTTGIALGGYKQYGVGDATTSLTVRPLASRGVAGQIAVAYDASNRVSGLRCRDLAPTCVIEVLTDLDGDGDLEDETGTAIETLNGTATLYSAQLERDPTGGWVAGTLRRAFAANVAVAHDRNGDGDFADAGEIAVIESAGAALSQTKSELAVDAAGRVAYAYVITGVGVRLAWDRNGDGDFADTVTGNPELVTLAGAGANCFDLAFDSANHLAVSYESGGRKLFRDTNDDGDFSDPGEELLLDATPGSCPVIAATSGAGLALAFDTALWVDRNGDGDFADPAEQAALASSIGNTGALEGNGTDRVIAAGVGNVSVGVTAP